MSDQPGCGLDRLFWPRSIAVFGASEQREKFGGRILHALVDHEFPGRIVPINPHHPELLGRPCHPTLAAAGGTPPDVAILAVPASAIEASVGECADAGVRGCVILTIGFAEAGPAGVVAQDRLVATARRAGMRIIGPNCLGYFNPHAHLVMSSSATTPPPMLAGTVGLVSQSGALMVSMYHRARDAGIGFSLCASLGNQADVEIAEVVEYLATDPHTRAVCLYVEEFKDPERIRRAVAACRASGKPVLAVKVGRTPAGAKVAQSHTASLAGSYEVIRAVLGDDGVLFTDDPDGMVLAADVLTRVPRLRSDGVGVLSPSGGGAGVAADRLAELGLRLATLQPQTRAHLSQWLIDGSASNPVDLGARREGDPETTARSLMGALAADPDVGIVLVPLTTMPLFVPMSRALAEAAQTSGVPTLVVMMPGRAGDEVRHELAEIGCRTYDRLDDALRVVQVLVAHDRQPPADRGRAPRRPARMPQVPWPTSIPSAGRLTELEAKALLGEYGIPVNRGALATTLDAARRAAATLGYPVALKVVARPLVHKTEAGAVRLQLRTPADLVRAWTSARAQVRHHLPGVALDGCLIQEMRTGALELLVGARIDPQFGPVVTVAFGGILAELVADVQLAPAPLHPARARALVDQLRLSPLLHGVRGGAPLDIAAVVDVLVRLSWLAVDHRTRLHDLEINPLLVAVNGHGAVAVDARGTAA